MKKAGLFFLGVIFVCVAHSQNATIRKDTIMAGSVRYGCLMSQLTAQRYLVTSLVGEKLIDIHRAHVEVKGQPAFVVTFLNDHGQAFVAKGTNFPTSLIKELIDRNILNPGGINYQAESLFISTHPLPDGYTDPDKAVEGHIYEER